MNRATLPNILFIMSDQMTAALTGVYGHPVVKTPHLERLAADGVRFDAAYTPFPLCAPGRACMMTGRDASAIGAWDNGCLTTADQPTFAHYATLAGYDAVLSGKMHFVGPDQLHGFRRRLTTDIYSADFSWVREEWIQIKEAKGKDCEAVMSQRASYNSRAYVAESIQIGTWHNALAYDEETHHRAIGYLRAKAARNDGPFLLVASYHHPHEPFHAPREYWDMYEEAEIAIPEFPENLDDTYSMLDMNLNAYHGRRHYNLRDPDGLRKLRRAYYGLTTYMDRKVGELLDVLAETGLADNTLVVFASDHGDMLCEKEMVQKRNFYEPSCRVPLIARFPDRWKAGTTHAAPVSLLDLLPTFAEVCGYDDLLPHDGESLLGQLTDGDPDRIVFAQAHEAIGMPCMMARQGRFKYHYIHGYNDQLFDLEADPGEWKNLIGNAAHQETAARLRGAILERFDPAWMEQENLESLYRRRLVRDVNLKHGRTWAHQVTWDPGKGAAGQYL